MSTRTRHARALFAGIAPEYEWMGAVLSFGQDPRWRRSLVSRVDALTFTYLLRYVDDPVATMRELARVVSPGGVIASLEFHVPGARWARAAWRPYTRYVMPLVGSVVSPAWAGTARFLSRSIDGYWRAHPLREQLGWWEAAGIEPVHTRTMSNGAAIVTWGVKR